MAKRRGQLAARRDARTKRAPHRAREGRGHSENVGQLAELRRDDAGQTKQLLGRPAHATVQVCSTHVWGVGEGWPGWGAGAVRVGMLNGKSIATSCRRAPGIRARRARRAHICWSAVSLPSSVGSVPSKYSSLKFLQMEEGGGSGGGRARHGRTRVGGSATAGRGGKSKMSPHATSALVRLAAEGERAAAARGAAYSSVSAESRPSSLGMTPLSVSVPDPARNGSSLPNDGWTRRGGEAAGGISSGGDNRQDRAGGDWSGGWVAGARRRARTSSPALCACRSRSGWSRTARRCPA